MAINSNFKQHINISFVLIFVLVVCLSHTKSLEFDTFGSCDDGAGYKKPRNCAYGSFNLTSSDNCLREFCYVGFHEYCDLTVPETTCAHWLTCNCYKCMNCKDSACYTEC